MRSTRIAIASPANPATSDKPRRHENTKTSHGGTQPRTSGRSDRSSCLRGGLRGPSHSLEAADAALADLDPFRAQQLAFELQVAAVTAKGAARRDDAVTGHAGIAAVPHDVADGAVRAWLAREGGDVAVRCDATRRDPAYRSQDLRRERRSWPSTIRVWLRKQSPRRSPLSRPSPRGSLEAVRSSRPWRARSGPPACRARASPAPFRHARQTPRGA